MHGGGESGIGAYQGQQEPEIVHEKRQDSDGFTDAVAEDKRTRGNGGTMYADNLEAEEREARESFLRRVGELNRSSVQRSLEKHRENAGRLFKLFNGSLGSAPASYAQEAESSSLPPVQSLAPSEAVEQILQNVGTALARNLLVYLWKEHHLRDISAIQSSLRLARHRADKSNGGNFSLRQKGTLELKLERDFISAIDNAELVYDELYKRVHAKAAALLEVDSDVCIAHSDSCSDANFASERGVSCGIRVEREDFDCLITNTEHLLQGHKIHDTERSKCLCIRHLLAHIRLIVADLYRYRDAVEDTFSSPDKGAFANCIVPTHLGNNPINKQSESLLGDISNTPDLCLIPFVGCCHLRSAAELYFQSLFFFADDAASCSQLSALYVHLSSKATQHGQRLLRRRGQRRVLLRASRSEVEGDASNECISKNAKCVAVTYELAALYWSYRSCICSFPLKTGDPLTRLLNRLGDSAIFNCIGQGNPGSIDRQMVEGAEPLQNDTPCGWQHVSSSFAYLLQTVNLRLDLDEFPGKCLCFVLQMQRTLQEGLPTENDFLMLVLLVLNAACSFLKSTGVMEPTQQVTAGIMARAKNSQTESSALSGTNSEDIDWVDVTTRLYAAVPDAPLDSLRHIQLRLLQDGGSCEAALLLCCSVCVLFADAADELLRSASRQDVNLLEPYSGLEDGFRLCVSESHLGERDLGALSALLAPLQCFLILVHHSHDLFRCDMECLQHLRQRVAELVVRLFDWSSLHSAALCRSHSLSGEGSVVASKPPEKDDEGSRGDAVLCELENVLQQPLPEDWLLVGLGKYPMEMPRKAVVLVGPSAGISSLAENIEDTPNLTSPVEHADCASLERISTDFSMPQAAFKGKKQSAKPSHGMQVSSDEEEEELLLRMPLIVRMGTPGCTEEPSEGAVDQVDASEQNGSQEVLLALGGHRVRHCSSNSNPLLNLRVRAARLLLLAMETKELKAVLSSYWQSSCDASMAITEEGIGETISQKAQTEATVEDTDWIVKRVPSVAPRQRRGSCRGRLRRGVPSVSANSRQQSLRLPRPHPTEGGSNTVEFTRESVASGGYLSRIVRTSNKERLIVIDGNNVAMGHGSGSVVKGTSSESGTAKPRRVFSAEGICIVVSYYEERGYKVRVFVPQYVVCYDSVAGAKRMEKAKIPVSGTRLPDNVKILRDLQERSILIATPPQDYDDHYIIQYAMMHDGCIVSNDMYRDVVQRAQTFKKKLMIKQWNWLKRHSISFVFIGDEFMPNPDFRWPDDDGEGRQLALELEHFLMECKKDDVQD